MLYWKSKAATSRRTPNDSRVFQVSDRPLAMTRLWQSTTGYWRLHAMTVGQTLNSRKSPFDLTLAYSSTGWDDIPNVLRPVGL